MNVEVVWTESYFCFRFRVALGAGENRTDLVQNWYRTSTTCTKCALGAEVSVRRKKVRGTVFTIGHSTRPLAVFIEMLRAHGVRRVVDVRSIPRSRHNPQFNRETLARRLRSAGIGYVHLKKLGGLRHAKADSGNLGWHNSSFRGFADYMQTEEFLTGLARLEKLATGKPTAIMCAEAVPWRCHRSLIADALLMRDFPVEDIMSVARAQEHELTPFARVRGLRITYPTDKPAKS